MLITRAGKVLKYDICSISGRNRLFFCVWVDADSAANCGSRFIGILKSSGYDRKTKEI
jgi:hypothetical protein